MAHRKRFAREDPPRTEPIRDWSGLFKPTGRVEQSTAHPKSGIDNRATDAATRAINLGYRVIEENLAQGRRVAEQAVKPPEQFSNPGAEIQEFFQRTLRYTAEIMPLWMDLMNAMASSDALRRLFTPPASTASYQPFSMSTPSSSNGLPTFSIELHSSRPAAVNVDIKQYVDPSLLMINGLRSSDPRATPIESVSFAPSNGNGRYILRVKVQLSQPSGTYSGLVIRRDSGEPLGIITVRLDD